jgi:hypothetical protein
MEARIMSTQKLAVTLIACVALTLTASAQDLDLWDINVDVDRDGTVGPTDIQQVINAALGIRDSGPDALQLPVRQYVVASPRAALAPVRRLQDEVGDTCPTQGAVFNFARPRGRILARQGTMIIFRYDRNTEGVWYNGACGLLRSELNVEMRPASFPREEQGQPDDPTSETTEKQLDGNTGDLPDEEPVWIQLGHDGVERSGCGPAVGTANIGVRHLFEQPGDYLVRATIRTAAIPRLLTLDPAESASDAACGVAHRSDQVFVAVRIVNPDDINTDFRWQELGQADEVHHVFGDTLRHELDPDVVLPE